MPRPSELIVKYQRVLRYLIVGGLAVVVEYSSFYIMFSIAGWEIIPANAASFTLGLLTSFILQRLWTFSNTDKQYSKGANHQFVLYGSLAIFNLVIGTAILKVISSLGIDPYIGKFIVMALIASWNYVVFNRIIFKNK